MLAGAGMKAVRAGSGDALAVIQVKSHWRLSGGWGGGDEVRAEQGGC